MKYKKVTHTYLFKKVFQTLLLVFVIGTCANAQTTQISGRVTANQSDTAVAGASIKVKGTNIGAAAGDNGNFIINAKPNATLIITAIGYVTQEVAVNNQTSINIHLATDVSTLQQLVVVGYGTQKRKDVTGAIASVSAATIAKVPVTTLDQAIQGRAPGVQVINNDASPGGNAISNRCGPRTRAHTRVRH